MVFFSEVSFGYRTIDSFLRASWKKLLKMALTVQDRFQDRQDSRRDKLLNNCKILSKKRFVPHNLWFLMKNRPLSPVKKKRNQHHRDENVEKLFSEKHKRSYYSVFAVRPVRSCILSRDEEDRHPRKEHTHAYNVSRLSRNSCA